MLQYNIKQLAFLYFVQLTFCNYFIPAINHTIKTVFIFNTE